MKFICTKCRKESITDLRGEEKYLCYECALEKQKKDILEKIRDEIICHHYDYKYSEDEILHSIDNVRQQLNSENKE